MGKIRCRQMENKLWNQPSMVNLHSVVLDTGRTHSLAMKAITTRWSGIRARKLYLESEVTLRFGHVKNLPRTIVLTLNLWHVAKCSPIFDYGGGMAAQLRSKPARRRGQEFCPAHDSAKPSKTSGPTIPLTIED